MFHNIDAPFLPLKNSYIISLHILSYNSMINKGNRYFLCH
ncbi:hypothetical protein FM106_24305 [Brachybacterium faecium]|nr:hypothetical protein FM106_24305 [Brachybacterium faecium]